MTGNPSLELADPARAGGPRRAEGDVARHRSRAETTSEGARTSYYGIPVIHKPHWKWLIIVYFFLGGIAGAAYVIASVSDLVGPRRDRRIVRAGRYLSLAALIPCPVLLILDLHRPERFYRMLRVLKLHSPMSIGTWGLVVFGGFSGLAAVAQAADDGFLGEGWVAATAHRLPARSLGLAGSPFALFVTGYTGPLLAATAVPLWTKRAIFLGPLFLCSAFSAAAAAITATVALPRNSSAETLHRIERLESVAAAAELAVLAAWLSGLGPTARPIRTGATGRWLRRGTIGAGLLLPLVLQAAGRLLPQPIARIVALFSSALVLVGAFVLRYAVVAAGSASADDPQATFELTRSGSR